MQPSSRYHASANCFLVFGSLDNFAGVRNVSGALARCTRCLPATKIQGSRMI